MSTVRNRSITQARLFLLLICLLLPAAHAANVTNHLGGIIIYDGSSPMGEFHGTNTAVTGMIVLNPTGGLVSGNVTVNLAQWESGNRIRDGHTQTMFETKTFPLATFTPTGMKGQTNAGPVVVTGTLSLHGVNRPVEIPGTLGVSHGRRVFRGDLTLKLTDWKLKRPTLMGAAVADEVKVHVRGEEKLP